MRRGRTQRRAALHRQSGAAGAPARLDACRLRICSRVATLTRRACVRHQVGHVLRLPKRPASRPGARSDAAHARLERLLWQHVPEYAGAAHQAHRSWLFAAHVLVPLLGEREAAAGKLVTAPAQFVRALSRALGDGVVLDAAGEDGRCVGVLLPDHAHFPARALSVTPPVVTVELKPKCGFLPGAESTQQCAKRSVSRFAMHQRLKLKDGHVSKARACGPSTPERSAHKGCSPAGEPILPARPVFARAGAHACCTSRAAGCTAEQLDGPLRRQAGVWRRWLLWQSPRGERVRWPFPSALAHTHAFCGPAMSWHRTMWSS